MSIDQTLTERNSTHGDFTENARISQELKIWFVRQPGYNSLTYVQREAFDQFAIKMARILSGGGNILDNWHDIAGYATLAERELRMLELQEQITAEHPQPPKLTARRPGIHAVDD